MSASPPPASDHHQSAEAVSRFWEDGRGPESGDEFAVLGAMTIGMSARNTVEDLHVGGAFSDKQAPALNRRLRNRAYEVLLAVQANAETGYDDRLVAFLADRAELDSETGPGIEPIAAMRGAIRAAVRDFAQTEHMPTATAEALETAAVDGATSAFKALQSLDELQSAREISYLAWLVPSYWELPEVAPELREMFGLISDE
jgi:hypothetical protein